MEETRKKDRKSKLFNLLNVDSLIDSVLQYFEKRIELVKVEIKEEAASDSEPAESPDAVLPGHIFEDPTPDFRNAMEQGISLVEGPD